jgi:hypothetical protein
MAKHRNKASRSMSRENAGRGSQRRDGQFALDNLTYDIITVLHEKSKGLEAFERYMRDAQRDGEIRKVFERMRQEDERMVRELEDHLGRILGQGGRRERMEVEDENIERAA